MKKSSSITAIVVILVVGALLALAGSDGGAAAGGVGVFAVCTLVAFVVNWIVFVHAFKAQTEHYFDLTGSLTYLTLVVTSLVLTGDWDLRSIVLGVLIGIWAGRLGSFLFKRVRQDGRDGRFDPIKPDFAWFLMSWTLQGLWVLFTMAAALAAITSGSKEDFGIFGVLGVVVWVVGFAIEVTADQQKRAFRADPVNDGRYITTGLWAWSRHPNYFGEITLWLGIAIIAFPALSGFQLVTLISPVFVYVLLTRISGIPMLESRAKKRWGDEPEFREYKKKTPALVLRPPKA